MVTDAGFPGWIHSLYSARYWISAEEMDEADALKPSLKRQLTRQGLQYARRARLSPQMTFAEKTRPRFMYNQDECELPNDEGDEDDDVRPLDDVSEQETYGENGEEVTLQVTQRSESLLD